MFTDDSTPSDYVADYEVSLSIFDATSRTDDVNQNPISPDILRAVNLRVVAGDKNDHLLLPPEVEEAGPYEVPIPREVTGIEVSSFAIFKEISTDSIISLADLRSSMVNTGFAL